MALRLRAQLLEYSPAAITCGAILRVDDTALGPGCLWPGERPAFAIDAGRNNEHWYVGAGLVLRRYGPFRSDAAIDYEHAIVGAASGARLAGRGPDSIRCGAHGGG